MTDYANLEVTSDHRVPVGSPSNAVTINLISGSTLYYGDRQVSATQNIGNLTGTQSVTVPLNQQFWIISASVSQVQVATIVPTPVVTPVGFSVTGLTTNTGSSAPATMTFPTGLVVFVGRLISSGTIADATTIANAGSVPSPVNPKFLPILWRGASLAQRTDGLLVNTDGHLTYFGGGLVVNDTLTLDGLSYSQLS